MGMTGDLASWSDEQRHRKAVTALENNGFTARLCTTPQAASERILAGITAR